MHRRLKALGVVGIVFFTIKGLAWLALAGAGAVGIFGR